MFLCLCSFAPAEEVLTHYQGVVGVRVRVFVFVFLCLCAFKHTPSERCFRRNNKCTHTCLCARAYACLPLSHLICICECAYTQNKTQLNSGAVSISLLSLSHDKEPTPFNGGLFTGSSWLSGHAAADARFGHLAKAVACRACLRHRSVGACAQMAMEEGKHGRGGSFHPHTTHLKRACIRTRTYSQVCI